MALRLARSVLAKVNPMMPRLGAAASKSESFGKQFYSSSPSRPISSTHRFSHHLGKELSSSEGELSSSP
ncbi:unnamed protein product [Arabis nemorensis]|uniref:Uncharacterized protein n=1 Tax=Arabis nemorensis TaxID=586526 RepID=A0A565CF05_9BRAS|nr:unnamed protein product [Arabis nemorensis]